MPKQKGLFKMRGTYDDVTGRRTRYGFTYSEKSPLDAERIRTDPRFIRTRENAQEFGRSVRAAQLLKNSFKEVVLKARDRFMHSRTVSLMSKILHLDNTNVRGERRVTDGDLMLLDQFQFNNRAPLSSVMNNPFTATIERLTGVLEVVIPSFSPESKINVPPGTTHFRIANGGAEIDFEAGTYETDVSYSSFLPWVNTATSPITLTTNVTPNSTKFLALMVGIEFYQEVSGTKYPLSSGQYNGFALVKVDQA
jgi:hypothetical protein